MLSTLNLIIYGFVAFVVLPLTLMSLLSGSRPPENTFLTKYYHAEPYLMTASNVFLLVLCAIAVLKVLLHFGLIDLGLAETIDGWLMAPFFLLLFVFLGLFVRAILKVRKASSA
jgi:hypothetical protein